MRRGGHLERTDERCRRSQRDLDVGATGELEHGAGVALHVVEVDVAGHARHGNEVDLLGGAGVQQGETVVDAGIDVEDDRDPFGGHVAGSGPGAVGPASSRGSRTMTGKRRAVRRR